MKRSTSGVNPSLGRPEHTRRMGVPTRRQSRWQWLYFAAVRPGTTTDAQGNPTIDILVSPLQDDGIGEPLPVLPAPINTAFSDKAPYLHPDGRTLVFCLQPHPGRRRL